MGKIALLADKPTSAYFKVTGIKNSYAVKDRDEAEKVFRKVHSDETISLIMVTDTIMGWIQPILERTKKEFPLVVSIPSKGGPKAQADLLAQLIKRTVGIELKM
ncbi:MAG: V-type ATP synthase subunit F [Candidatus Bathyarchaeia archaeon]